MQRVEVRSGERGLNVHRTGPYSLRKQGSCDVPAFSSAFAPVESGNNGSVKTDRCCVVSAAGGRKRRRSARIAGQRQQPGARPESGDVKSRKVSVGSVVAVAGDVSVNQARVPCGNLFVGQLEPLARGMREVDDENVSPLDETL